MNIDKWDLFAVCESLLLVADKPLTIEQVVNVLLAEQEDELERLADEADAAAGITRNDPEPEVTADPAFDLSLRSDTAEASLAADDSETPRPEAGEGSDERSESQGEGEAPVEDTPIEAAPIEAAPIEVESEPAQQELLPDPKATDPKATEEKESARRAALVRRELSKLVQDAFDAMLVVYNDPARTLGRGFQLVNVGGAYQLRTAPAVAAFVRHHLQVKPTRLSRAQLEILAIIAYRQPVTRPEIDQIRGVDCGAGLKVLLDRRLVRILGKKEEVGRPLLYGTSKEFLELFKLGSLLELPTLREFQELTDEHRKQVDETLTAEAPLGNLKELVETAENAFAHDDSALVADLDSALQGARATVNRVAELTGLKKDEDEPLPPPSTQD